MTLQNSLDTSAPSPQVTLPLADLRIDPELQCRANGLSKATVREYSEAMKAGAVFPAVVAFRDSKGVNWLADGFHRTASAELAGLTEIAADVREGSRRDALLFAAGANASHGLKRSQADRRASVAKLLAEPSWAKRADNWLAKHAAVSPHLVAKVRSTLQIQSEGPRETADGRVMNTRKIGRVAVAEVVEETEEATVARLTAQLEAAITGFPPGYHSQLRSLLVQWSDALAPAEVAS
jgi:hypothetical protein